MEAVETNGSPNTRAIFPKRDEEKQFFQTSHQNGLLPELYFPLKERRERGDILVLYGGDCDNRRVGGRQES